MGRRVWPPITIGLVSLLAIPCHTSSDGTAPALRVLFPTDQSTIETGRLELICIAGEGVKKPPALRVDGKARRWQPFALPVLVARLELKPGRHEIAIGATKLRVCVTEGDPPSERPEWPAFSAHPDGADGWRDCGACHEVTEANGRQSIGALREPTACQHCHSSEDFQLAHFHPEKPLAGCHQCHALHGSSAKSLLKAPRKQLCAACHD